MKGGKEHLFSMFVQCFSNKMFQICQRKGEGVGRGAPLNLPLSVRIWAM